MGPAILAALGALAALTASSLSCGETRPDPPQLQVRLVLAPLEGTEWDTGARVVSRAEPAAAPERWSLLSESPEPNDTLQAMEAEGRAVILSGMGARSRSVAILSEPIDPSAFNQVRIQHVIDGETSVKIVLRGRELEDWSSGRGSGRSARGRGGRPGARAAAERARLLRAGRCAGGAAVEGRRLRLVHPLRLVTP